MRHRYLVVTLGVMLAVALAGCRGPERSPKPQLHLITAHRCLSWKTEIPADLDMDGEDEILLVTHGRRSLIEPTQVYRRDILDNFLDGPRSPPGDIQDLAAFDLDGDGKTRELALCLRDPSALEILSHTLDSLATHPLPGCDSADVRLQAAFDADETDSLEILLSVTKATDPTETRLIAFNWAFGRELWSVDLPGMLEGSVLHLTAHGEPRLVAAFAHEAGTGFLTINARGDVIRRKDLTTSPSRACVLAITYPLRGPQLVTLAAGGLPREGILTSWHALGATMDQQRPVPDATLPALGCHHKNACGIAVGTLRGEIIIFDRKLLIVASHKVAEGAVRLVTTADLDLNGSSDVICRTDQGRAVCLCLPSGDIASCEARDGVQVVHDKFGARPIVLARNGECYSYYELKCPASYGLSGIPVNTSRAVLAVAILGIVGLVVGRSAAATGLQRGVRRLFVSSALPTGLVGAGGSLLWANESLEKALGGEVPLKPRKPLNEHLRAAGFTHPLHPAHSSDCGIPRSILKDDRCFTCGAVPLGRDAFGRRRVLVHVTEDPRGSSVIIPDPWAAAAREITAQMRNSLSTIRLTVQWLLTHHPTKEKHTGLLGDRLGRVLREAKSLQSLADVLARAAAVHKDEPADLHPGAVIREAVRGLSAEESQRLGVHVPKPTPTLVGIKRQVILALQIICGVLTRDTPKEERVRIAVSGHPDAHQGKGSVTFEISLERQRARGEDEEPVLPSYATAVADAVAQTHGGFVSTDSHGRGCRIAVTLPRGGIP
jgi:hypothetical protein